MPSKTWDDGLPVAMNLTIPRLPWLGIVSHERPHV